MRSVVPLLALMSISVTSAEVSYQQGAPPNQAVKRFAFTHVSVIPMTRDVILEDQTVLVVHGRISALGPSTSVVLPPGTQVLNAKGQFLIPGLSDMHAHLRRSPGNRPEDYLAQGITVARNMQGDPSHLEFRDQVRAGHIPGPIVVTAGPAIAGRRISRRHEVPESKDAARKPVRDHASAGYDYIKVYSLLSREMYDAILDEAGQVSTPCRLMMPSCRNSQAEPREPACGIARRSGGRATTSRPRSPGMLGIRLT